MYRVYSAANYLRSSGAPGDYGQAIFAYNKSSSYVADVEHWAALYRAPTASQTPLAGAEAAQQEGADRALEGESSTPVQFIAGERALLAPADGHLALVPAGVPAIVQAMVVAGNELQELPYGPGGHPDPRGALEEDCSSTINYVLYRSGCAADRGNSEGQPAGPGLCWLGRAGPGQVGDDLRDTAPTNHVFIVVAG